MHLDLISLGLLATLLISKLSYNEAISFKLTNLVCEKANNSQLTINECGLKAVSRNRTVLNVELYLPIAIHNVTIVGQLYQKAGVYKPMLYKASIDACRFFRRPSNPIAIVCYRQFKDFSNFNHTCPYQGLVYVRGFYPRSDVLPYVLPNGDYLATAKWILNNKLQVTSHVYFSFFDDLLPKLKHKN